MKMIATKTISDYDKEVAGVTWRVYSLDGVPLTTPLRTEGLAMQIAALFLRAFVVTKIRREERQMTFKEAKKQLRKVGTSRAQGDALRAMYADLIAFKWFAIGNPEKFYAHLQTVADSEQAIAEEARALLRDSSMALDVVLV